MRILLGAILGAATALATYFYVYWIPGSQYLRGAETRWLRVAASVLCAAIAAAFVFHRTWVGPKGAIEAVAFGALALGSLGFVLGFFGPLLLAPEANQGPLLGLFIMGPLGFVCGAAGGWIYWEKRSRARQTQKGG